jgi:hypothetical protein
MASDDDFDDFNREIKSDPLGVLLAKWRRDAFIAKLKRLPDVIEVIPSGSLARDTLTGPVHDVDLIVVFDKSAHPDYGKGPESARAAMTYLEEKLLEQLHPLSGTEALIKGTEQRTHVVNCHGGSTGPYAEFIPSAPPVDVMPAVRKEPNLLGKSPLLVPELGEGGAKWIDVDPETFMRQVEQRQREWKYFTEVIKMVKTWAKLNDLNMKTVAIEAMVLLYCPRPRMFETLSRGEAIARFFEAASKARITSLKDPAGRCGEIDKKMDFGKLRSKLKVAAGLARQAMDAEYAWENRFQLMQGATPPSVFWRKLFGKEYPEARERYWRPAVIEPWFGKYKAERRVTPDQAWFDVPRPPGGGSKPPDDPKPPNDQNPTDDLNPPDDLNPDTPQRPFRDLNEPGLNPDRHGDRTARNPGGPGATDGAGDARRQPRTGRHTEPASAEPGTGLWTKVFGPAAATVSVPLTFG